MQEQLEKTVEQLEKEVEEAKTRLLEARKQKKTAISHDYVFEGWNGLVKLSELFGEHDELIIVHNMGESCPYCTLWADGFNGVHAHITGRCAFVVVSPDDTEKQKQFAGMRGWVFKMCSDKGSSFTKDMGFEPTPGAYWPGMTTFSKGEDGTVYKVSSATFGPGDDFCPIWHMFGLLEKGDNGWEPNNSYHPVGPSA